MRHLNLRPDIIAPARFRGNGARSPIAVRPGVNAGYFTTGSQTALALPGARSTVIVAAR